ncbi:MAG: MbnP family protein, partial [Flavitalea sp.]
MYAPRWLGILSFILLFSACAKEDSTESLRPSAEGAISLSFRNTVNNATLNFTDQYTNDCGETYTVSRFRYYVHDIQLLNNAGEAVNLSSDYFLVDEDIPASKTLTFKTPIGNYTSLIYTLGVDSARNMSGAQTGALDPGKGMFWTWNSGYVMAKLEGHADVSNELNHEFTYHVGGYKSPYIVIRKITLPIDDAGALQITRDTSLTINIKADINTWFSHNVQVKI